MPKLRIIKEAVFTKDKDGDGKAEVPADRKGETKPPKVDIEGGLDDANNDGETDTYSDDELIKMADEEGEPIDQLNQQIPDEALPGDDELADALGGLDEGMTDTIKLKIVQEETLSEGFYNDEDFSRIRPQDDEAKFLVYNKPNGTAPPLEKGMVRLAARVDHEGIGKMHRGQMKYKSYEKNMVKVYVTQPGFKVAAGDPRSDDYQRFEYGEGPLDMIEKEIKVDAKFIDEPGDGRFVDVANWVLRKHGITDQRASILDYNGKVIATKWMQKKLSNAGSEDWSE